VVFSSITFLFYFLPLFLAAYFLPRKQHNRNKILLAFSLIFYAWGEPAYIFLMLLSITINWYLGKKVGTAEFKGTRKGWVCAALIFNLAMLVFFKYAAFLINSVGLTPLFADSNADFVLNLALPIGISFYTFQAMSYLIDVYRGRFPYESSILDLGAYISMFPQLIAGPIVRYGEIKEQLHSTNTSYADVVQGTRLFIIGLSFKVLLANTFAGDADYVFSLDAWQVSTGLSWLGSLSYTFQIYFDFAGYSLMAIGLGRAIGFSFPINFNRPYISTSITEFWRRWHISLSSWFRDYLYIPLGGNRRGPVSTYFNLFIVFFLCGLWHGAAWNFAIWGCFHGMFLVIERMFKSTKLIFPRPVAHLYAILIIIFSWVIFRSESLYQVQGMLASMLSLSSGNTYVALQVLDWSYVVMAGVGVYFSTFHVNLDTPPAAKSYLVTHILYFLLFVVNTFYLVVGTHNPFIYFRF
jgi:alginate O-acetyltransferase complex protein AlgI